MARSRDPAEDRTRGSPTDGLGQRAPFRRVDRVVIPVPNLREGLAFYRDGLGHEVVWLADDSAGLRLPDSETELVLQTRRAEFVPDLTVDSLDRAVDSIARAGGSVSGARFRTRAGRCAVVKDPWGNRFVLREDGSEGEPG